MMTDPIRLYWIDWLVADSPRFDVQAMIEYCAGWPKGSCSVEIRNALGRFGGEQAEDDDRMARVAIVTFAFAQDRERHLFEAKFAAEVAAYGVRESMD
jgi:hypothetical protein